MFVSRKEQQKMGIVQDTSRHFVTAAPTQQPAPQALPPTTALAVQPIKPSALLDSHNQLIGVYREQYKDAARVGEVMPPGDDRSAPRGNSSSAELHARNQRFFVTIGAMVGVAAMGMAGLVQIAAAAGIVGQSWQLPMWLGLTGISAMLIVRSVHGSEQRLSPENIELARAENQFAIEHMDAQTRQLAIRLAARNDRERVKLERERNDAQREAGRLAALETQRQIAQQMARHTTPQNDRNRLNNYRPIAPQTPQNGLGWPVDDRPIEYGDNVDLDVSSAILPVEQEAPIVDPVRQCLLNFVSDLYLDYSHDGESNTKKYNRMHADGRLAKGTIVPWAQRSNLTAAQRRQMEEILRQITPDLFSYDSDRKQWALNLASYPRVYMAINAIGMALTPIAT